MSIPLTPDRLLFKSSAQDSHLRSNSVSSSCQKWIYPRFGSFTVVKVTACIAHCKTLLASTEKQLSCILFYETNQICLGNSWNFGGFPVDFRSLIFNHSKLGIPFKSRWCHISSVRPTMERYGGIHFFKAHIPPKRVFALGTQHEQK